LAPLILLLIRSYKGLSIFNLKPISMITNMNANWIFSMSPLGRQQVCNKPFRMRGLVAKRMMIHCLRKCKMWMKDRWMTWEGLWSFLNCLSCSTQRVRLILITPGITWHICKFVESCWSSSKLSLYLTASSIELNT